jgi:hypothetical protein
MFHTRCGFFVRISLLALDVEGTITTIVGVRVDSPNGMPVGALIQAPVNP